MPSVITNIHQMLAVNRVIPLSHLCLGILHQFSGAVELLGNLVKLNKIVDFLALGTFQEAHHSLAGYKLSSQIPLLLVEPLTYL